MRRKRQRTINQQPLHIALLELLRSAQHSQAAPAPAPAPFVGPICSVGSFVIYACVCCLLLFHVSLLLQMGLMFLVKSVKEEREAALSTSGGSSLVRPSLLGDDSLSLGSNGLMMQHEDNHSYRSSVSANNQAPHNVPMSNKNGSAFAPPSHEAAEPSESWTDKMAPAHKVTFYKTSNQAPFACTAPLPLHLRVAESASSALERADVALTLLRDSACVCMALCSASLGSP